MKAASRVPRTPDDMAACELIAISGGRDSVALLHWLVSSGHRRLILCHLNHGLRGRESGQDAAFVRRLAKHYDLPCEISKADVASFAREQHLSLETAGRQLRHCFLFEMAARHRASRVYLAHHADDQAETILANLCRGTSVSGLSGMQPETLMQLGARTLHFMRPFLYWQRSEIDAYVLQHQLKYREDSTNSSLEHRRNRLRHEVLPLLKEVFARDVAPIISRLGRQAARDDEALRQSAESLTKKHLAADRSLRLTAALRQEPHAVLSRLMHRWLADTPGLTGIDTEIIERALSMLSPGGPAKINLPNSRHLRRKSGRMWVE